MTIRGVAASVALLSPGLALACDRAYRAAAVATEPAACSATPWLLGATGIGLLLGVIALRRAPRMSAFRSLLVLTAPALGLLMITSLVGWRLGLGMSGCERRAAIHQGVRAETDGGSAFADPCPYAAPRAQTSGPCDCSGGTARRLAVASLGVGFLALALRSRRREGSQSAQAENQPE